MLKSLIRRTVERLDRLALPLGSRSGVLASVYYLIVSRQFRREQRAVLAGRLTYHHGLGSAVHSSPLLRRNVHRIEKGLVMRPRQAVFAEDYIEETVEALLTAEQHGLLGAEEARWARDVLGSYFAAVTDTSRIVAARAKFQQRDVRSATDSGAAWQPQPRAEGVRSGVSFDAFMALCRQRRSVRWFLQQPVPRELVLKAVAAAAQAPSACNRQPFVFRYIDEAGDAQRIAGIAMGTTGYADNVPALAIVLGDLSCFPAERDRHVIYIDAALAAMQLMLALETLGLASCPINWPDVESLERRMDRELQLPPHIRPIMLIAIGYPDPKGGVPFSAKKPPEGLLRLSDDYAP
jgi:nitroreductase